MLSLACIFLFLTSALALSFWPANNPNIIYTGRHLIPITDSATFDWPGFHFTAAFSGNTLQVVIQNVNTATYSYHNVIIDGQLAGVLNVTGTKNVFDFSENLQNGNHTVLINQRGDPGYGPTAFFGFNLADGASILSPPTIPTRRVEFIGDSITTGGAVLGPCNVTIPVHMDQDNYLTYARLTATNVSADYIVTSASGIGMIKLNYYMPYFYNRTLMFSPEPLWNFTAWVPDAVVIHLGTNDPFSNTTDTTLYVNTYVDFIADIREKYSPAKPQFFLVCGSTIVPPIPWCPYAEKVASMTDALFVDLSNSVTSADIGCVGHPGPVGHQKMAAALTPHIQQGMNWW